MVPAMLADPKPCGQTALTGRAKVGVDVEKIEAKSVLSLSSSKSSSQSSVKSISAETTAATASATAAKSPLASQLKSEPIESASQVERTGAPMRSECQITSASEILSHAKIEPVDVMAVAVVDSDDDSSVHLVVDETSSCVQQPSSQSQSQAPQTAATTTASTGETAAAQAGETAETTTSPMSGVNTAVTPDEFKVTTVNTITATLNDESAGATITDNSNSAGLLKCLLNYYFF